ncbi:MAG: GDSL-type esterase/lipase family protein [Acidimicrobiales bacterium]|nr:GDSL-type esterase/lipase family protein [Acidimicrobiales bacterium]
MPSAPTLIKGILLAMVVVALITFVPPLFEDRSLKVVSIGDSVTYDADPGIRAALEATGAVVVETRSIGGVGLLRPGIDDYLDDALVGDPDVVVVMLGGWDLGEIVADPSAYALRLDDVANQLTAEGARLVWLAMPPTPPGEQIEDARQLANRLFSQLAERRADVDHVATGMILGDSVGAFVRFRTGLDGRRVQVRKVRGGTDDGHLCPGGAALLGQAVLELVANRFVLPEAVSEWWLGPWTDDLRYDDPPGGCRAVVVG